jgi:thioredoxin 1
MSKKTEKIKSNGAPVEFLTEPNFEMEVLRSQRPVLVVFWAEWSRPCQVLEPILQELARDRAEQTKVVKVNADECLDLSLFYEIQSIPTLLYFVEGRPLFRIVGTATKHAIVARLNPLKQKMTTAAKDLSRGRSQPGKEN